MAILNAGVFGLIAGLAMGVGGGLVAVFGTLNARIYDGMLGFAAGVMTALAASILVTESVEGEKTLVVLAGVAVGAGCLFGLDRILPHAHLKSPHGCVSPAVYRRGLLIFAALTLHNIPEGLAVGTSCVAAPRLGLLLATAIALHNVPEGVAVAAPFRASGLSRWHCVAWATGSGLAEPVAAVLGAMFVTLCSPLLPFSLAFASGAMLYVVSDELIPESHSHGHEHAATLGYVSGFLIVLTVSRLLTALG
jgi:ZIP family zinc transporter